MKIFLGENGRSSGNLDNVMLWLAKYNVVPMYDKSFRRPAKPPTLKYSRTLLPPRCQRNEEPITITILSPSKMRWSIVAVSCCTAPSSTAQVPIPSCSALRMPIRIPFRFLRILELLYILLRPPVQLLFQIRPVSQHKEKLEPDE